MPHQCTKCGKIHSDAAKEILAGCSCGSRFFYYIRQEKADEIEKGVHNEVKEAIVELEKADKDQIEKDIRDITGLEDKPDEPVILDLESVKVIRPGKFEIDIVNLFNKKRPLIYKLEEGKYIIDLSATLKANTEEINKKIVDPNAS
jgi:predicted  nucleic acid-binding Zn-ribbon protein